MTAQHTPGPWEYERGGRPQYPFAILAHEGAGYRLVADLPDVPTGAEANARLIAATPNLLKWAKAFQQHLIIEQGHSFGELDDDIAEAEWREP